MRISDWSSDVCSSDRDALAGTVGARITSGSARPSQGLEPRRLRAELADRRSDIEAEIAKAKAELTRWTGDPDPQVVGAPPDWALDPDRLLAVIDALPRPQALDPATAQADAAVPPPPAEHPPHWPGTPGQPRP